MRPKVAVVTGAASGLGRAVVERLSAAEVHVVMLDLPSSAGHEVAAKLGEGVTFVEADVTDERAVASAFEQAAELGTLRYAVSCAGIGWAGRILRHGRPLPAAAFEAVIGVNLTGTFLVARQAAAHMALTEPEGEDRGVIVLTASVAAFEGQSGQVAYAASKAGVAGMTLPLARDLAPHRIRVVTVAPGMFDTPLLAALPERARTEIEDASLHPHRTGRPSEYADLVLHITQNPMLNGEVIRLDGGVRLPSGAATTREVPHA